MPRRCRVEDISVLSRNNAQKEFGTFVATVFAAGRVGVRRCMIRRGLSAVDTIRLGSRGHCSFALSNSRETHISYYNTVEPKRTVLVSIIGNSAGPIHGAVQHRKHRCEWVQNRYFCPFTTVFSVLNSAVNGPSTGFYGADPAPLPTVLTQHRSQRCRHLSVYTGSKKWWG